MRSKLSFGNSKKAILDGKHLILKAMSDVWHKNEGKHSTGICHCKKSQIPSLNNTFEYGEFHTKVGSTILAHRFVGLIPRQYHNR